ncbi:hypothetical protein BV20DRAFT_419313 [Pilatotrama ljubarskyi]|nr:hypothetical protein BV20DRAFT_419313 [Pilatotrama ljubarskyi]
MTVTFRASGFSRCIDTNVVYSEHSASEQLMCHADAVRPKYNHGAVSQNCIVTGPRLATDDVEGLHQSLRLFFARTTGDRSRNVHHIRCLVHATLCLGDSQYEGSHCHLIIAVALSTLSSAARLWRHTPRLNCPGWQRKIGMKLLVRRHILPALDVSL